MRVMNLMIVLAVIAIILLAAQYISQLKKNKSGDNFVSGGRVFFNWVLAIILVVCIGGIAFGSLHSRRQEAKPAQTDKTENVEYASSSDDSEDVSVQFDKKVKMNDDGQVKVKFKVSPQTTLTIRGHKSKEIVKTFKASKGDTLVKHSYTFDVAGTYDIIAERGDHKVTKKLKVEAADNTSDSSSSSSEISSSSSATSSSSSSTSSSHSSSASSTQNNSNNSTANTTAASNNGGSRSSYSGTSTSRHYSSNGGSNTSRRESTYTPSPSPTTERPATTNENDGYVTDGPQD